MTHTETCPDCSGSGFQTDRQTECLRCYGDGRLSLTDDLRKEMRPVFTHSHPYLDWKRERDAVKLWPKVRWILTGLAWMALGAILGRLTK